MSSYIPVELIVAIRHLVDEVAPHDPDVAARRFDQLVLDYGREPCATVLEIVAPEVAELHTAPHPPNSAVTGPETK